MHAYACSIKHMHMVMQAIISAAEGGHIKCVSLLLDFGAEKDATNSVRQHVHIRAICWSWLTFNSTINIVYVRVCTCVYTCVCVCMCVCVLRLCRVRTCLCTCARAYRKAEESHSFDSSRPQRSHWLCSTSCEKRCKQERQGWCAHCIFILWCIFSSYRIGLFSVHAQVCLTELNVLNWCSWDGTAPRTD